MKTAMQFVGNYVVLALVVSVLGAAILQFGIGPLLDRKIKSRREKKRVREERTLSSLHDQQSVINYKLDIVMVGLRAAPNAVAMLLAYILGFGLAASGQGTLPETIFLYAMLAVGFFETLVATSDLVIIMRMVSLVHRAETAREGESIKRLNDQTAEVELRVHLLSKGIGKLGAKQRTATKSGLDKVKKEIEGIRTEMIRLGLASPGDFHV